MIKQTLLFAALAATGAHAVAQTHLFTDRFGNTSGTINGQSAHFFTDRFGNTSGRIGSRSIHCFSDRFGGFSCN